MTAPPVVWRPDEALLRESNVARFMAAEHIDDFATLVPRSIDEPEWFWDAVVRFLALPFDTPYDRVLDTSAGIEWATWFVGGRCNAATMCLDHLDADRAGGGLGRRGRRDAHAHRRRVARAHRSHRVGIVGARCA